MKATRKNINLCLTGLILFVLFLAVFMIGYISGSIIERIKISNIHTEDIYPLIEDEEVLMTSICEAEIPKSPIGRIPVIPVVQANSAIVTYTRYVNDICANYEFVDDLPHLIMAMMEVESNFDPSVISSAGCIGLMQVSPYWQTERAESLDVYDLWDPYGNILVAVDLLQDLYYNYANEDIVLAVMMYNMDFSKARSMYLNGQWSPYATKVFSIFDSLKG